MKRFLAIAIVLAILVAGLGFYRGWFTLSSSGSNAESSEVNINLAVDSGKMRDDAQSVKNKTTELTGNAEGEAQELSGRATDAAPPDVE